MLPVMQERGDINICTHTYMLILFKIKEENKTIFKNDYLWERERPE